MSFVFYYDVLEFEELVENISGGDYLFILGFRVIKYVILRIGGLVMVL